MRHRLIGCVHLAAVLAVFSCLAPIGAQASEPDEGAPVEIGGFVMTAPANWEKKQPRVRIIEHEFAVPATEGDETDGRVTVMMAGGSIEANLDRWYGQFKQPDGSSSAEAAQIDEREIAGQDVHLVDISGTYLDRRGPMAPAVERTDYRMLAAIVATRGGNYYIKFYGPQKTVADNAEAFEEMIDGLKAR